MSSISLKKGSGNLIRYLLSVSIIIIFSVLYGEAEDVYNNSSLQNEYEYPSQKVFQDSFDEAVFRQKWNKYPLDTLYHTPDDLFPAILSLTEDYPHLADWYITGQSSNHKLPIYAIRLTNKAIDKPKPSILLHGQHHAEEVIGLEIVMYMSRYLAGNYGADELITQFLDNYEFWFVPTSNPEGFNVVNSGEYRLKRKNETDTNLNGIRELHLDGVDLNRNYDINWNRDIATNPESPYFKGYEPACQAETRAMQNFYRERMFNLALFYHSSATGAYSERIFFPWIWDGEQSPEYNEMLRLARVLAANLPRNYEKGNYRFHQFGTSRRGFARDYIYANFNTLAMLIETGGNSPFGEGVLSPPNEVLIRLKEKHTQAFLSLIKEYDRNLLTVKVVDADEQPVRGIEIVIEGKESPHKRNIITCKNGTFFYYLLPREEPYNIVINKEIFSIFKSKNSRQNIVLKVDDIRTTGKTIEPVNDGQALVMTNPVFQYFPPLSVNKKTDNIQASVSLLDRYRIAYRQQANTGSRQIKMPWIPIDAVDRGVLTVQTRDVSPLMDKNKTANIIVFLNKERETLSYCLEMSYSDLFFFHPNTQIGIDYTLYPAGDNDYYVEEIRIYTPSLQQQLSLDIALYKGAEPLTEMRAVYEEQTERKGLFKVRLKDELKLPDNLFLTISNKTTESIPVLRDKFNQPVSKRNHIYYSYWQPLSGADLAVELILRKRTDPDG